MTALETTPQKPPRNPLISYLKGVALIMIVLIHLFDWSTLQAPFWIREFLYSGVVFFLFLAGAVIPIAYGNRPLAQSTKRLLWRGTQIFLIYYACNIIKFWLFSSGLYSLEAEPFYYQFGDKGTWNWEGILTLQSFSVPIGILLSIAMMLFISPIFLFITQKSPYPKLSLFGVLGIITWLGFFHTFEPSFFTDILFANGYIFFPPLLWAFPFLLGYFLAMVGLEEHQEWWFALSATGTIGFMYFLSSEGKEIFPTWYMYPPHLYYIIISIFVLFLFFRAFQELSKYSFFGKAYFLGLLRFWGDNTLSLYILHWIVVDITYYFSGPSMIAITVPLLMIGFTGVLWEKAKKAIAIEQGNT